MQGENGMLWVKRFEKRLNNRWIVLGCIAFFALLVYCNSFTAPFTLDDFSSISNNYAIRNPFDPGAIWKFYSNRFVLYYTISINYFIHDTAVVGYHIVNMLIHIVNGFLVFLILRNLLRLNPFSSRIPGRYGNILSLLSSLIFICHPLQVNAVTYIIQRTAALAATFYFLAILFFIRYRLQDKTGDFVLCLLFTVIAMFTKENTITIPFLLILLEFMFFLQDGKTSWKKRLLLLFILLLTVPIIPGTNLVLKGYSQSDPGVSFKASTSMNRFHYFYTQQNVILQYIKLLFVPIGQNFDYSEAFPKSKTLWENHSLFSFVILSFIGLFGLLHLRRNKFLSLGILWFFIGLAVESSFISIKDVYFEHRLYFPVVGYVIFLLGLVFYETGKTKRTYVFKKPVYVFIVLACILIPVYSGFTLYRNYVFSDSIRLWSDVVKKAPGSDRAHCILGTNYLDAYETQDLKREDYLDKAEVELKKAIELHSYNDTAYCNLSKVYYLKKDYVKCVEMAQKAISMVSSTYAYQNLGLGYQGLGQNNEAVNAFLSGYRLDNKCTFLLKSLGNIYQDMADHKNAVFYYEEFLKYNIYSDNEEIRKKLSEIKPRIIQEDAKKGV